MKATRVTQPDPKGEGNTIKSQPCAVCNKVLAAPYGRHNAQGGIVWTCSNRCEGLFKMKGD